MNANRLKKQKTLDTWYRSIPRRQVSAIRELLLKRLCIKPYTLTDWRLGRSELPENHIPVIEEIAGKKIFN